MEVISSTGRTRSGLNPDAAPYVPAALRAVEDFSPAWWALVESSPWFADYWMRERFQDWSEDDVADPFDVDDELDLPDDITDALISFPHPVEKAEGGRREVMAWGADKWEAVLLGCGAEGARYAEKAAKVVNVKVRPRMIQQPR